MSRSAWIVGGLFLLTACPADDEPAGGTDTDGGTSEGSEESGDPGSTSSDESTTGSTTDDSTSTTTSSTTDPTDGTSTTTDPTDPTDPGSSEDTGSSGLCAEPPTRMIIFGDSIFDCFGIPGGANGDGCGPRVAHEYLEANYAGGVTYENRAVSGAVTSDVINQQMPGTQVGQPGHALVVIWIGGNDISGLLLSSDQDAEDSYRNNIAPALDGYWESMLAWVDDPGNFPDGATLIVNTQYNPFDDCSAEPYNFMTPLKTGLLMEYNERIVERTQGRDATIIADQYGPFLGHGHHYATASCPNYVADSGYWMIGGADLIHPNGLGHATISATLRATLDELYGCE